MRTHEARLAEVLWPAARRRVLGLLFGNPERELHLREIVRRVELAPATVQREVVALAKAGVLWRREEGRQVYYRADRTCPIFRELQGIALKTVGLADVLREALQPLQDQITVAFVFGSMADGTSTNESDIDLLVVGQATLGDLAPGLQAAQAALGRETNTITMQPQELAHRAATGDHFVQTVLREPKIVLVGNEDDLTQLAESGSAAEA
jgi:predicted nucleotidyltransferase